MGYFFVLILHIYILVKSPFVFSLTVLSYLISHAQVVNKGDLPRYEIDTGETTKHVSPEEVAKLVFHKMKGKDVDMNCCL